MKYVFIILLSLLTFNVAVAPVKTQGDIYDELLLWQDQYRTKQLKIKIDTSEFSQELFYQALVLYVDCPDIVLNQARLESGWFKSPLFRIHNNPFGMKYALRRPSTASYKARIGRVRNYAGYKHWSDAVKDVALWQQYWKNKGKDQQSYYQFLQDLPYATSKHYIKTLKFMGDDT